MKIKDIFNKRVITLSPEDTLYDAVEKAMKEKTNGMFVVDSENRVLGIVTSNTLIKSIIPSFLRGNYKLSQLCVDGLFIEACESAKTKKIKDIMNKNIPLLTEDMKVLDVAVRIMKPDFTRLPVVDNQKKLLGIITRTQIRSAIAKALKIKV